MTDQQDDEGFMSVETILWLERLRKKQEEADD